jgi:hypothetical protein
MCLPAKWLKTKSIIEIGTQLNNKNNLWDLNVHVTCTQAFQWWPISQKFGLDFKIFLYLVSNSKWDRMIIIQVHGLPIWAFLPKYTSKYANYWYMDSCLIGPLGSLVHLLKAWWVVQLWRLGRLFNYELITISYAATICQPVVNHLHTKTLWPWKGARDRFI